VKAAWRSDFSHFPAAKCKQEMHRRAETDVKAISYPVYVGWWCILMSLSFVKRLKMSFVGRLMVSFVLRLVVSFVRRLMSLCWCPL
jgi:Na+/citrate or Na+/malate symporter